MDLKNTDFYRAAQNLKKLLTEAGDELSDVVPDAVEGDVEGEDDIAAEIKELMTKMTDEERETVQAALDILKNYAEEGGEGASEGEEGGEGGDEGTSDEANEMTEAKLAEAKGSASLKPRKPIIKKSGKGLSGKSIRGLVKK